jgi:hypothetical protein
MARPTNIQKLTGALKNLREGFGIHLGNDTFLCGELDGSDKIYGFSRKGDTLHAHSRQCLDGYPITQLDKDDIAYMFRLSEVFEKISKGVYKQKTLDANGHLDW